MEIETWIDGPSNPIPNPLPSEFSNREVYPVGYIGIANSSRRGGINAKINGKRIFGTTYHPYIVGGRFAWCNGVWFVLVCLKIPTVILQLNRYTIYDAEQGWGNSSGILISSAFYEDNTLESHFAFLESNYFAWINTETLTNPPPNYPYGVVPPRTESSSIPTSYYEVNLGIGAAVRKITASAIELLKCTALNQLSSIEIYPRKFCWSPSPPYLRDGTRIVAGAWNDDYFDMTKNLGSFSIQQCDPSLLNVKYSFPNNPQNLADFFVQETLAPDYRRSYPKHPILPDPSWTGIKATRTRSIEGFNFIEYAFEVKEQPCDIEITVDPVLSPSGSDKFCLEYEDYNQLLNRFDNIEQRLNELPS